MAEMRMGGQPAGGGGSIQGAGPSGTFARKSSGLVRQVSTQDAFFYGMNAITLSYFAFILFKWPNYPGASITWSIVITTLGAMCVGVVYALFASVYPRSGGEYVFASRIIHPLVGFLLSFSQGFWLTYYFGTNGAFMMLDGVSPMLSIMGIQLNNESLQSAGAWCGSPWGLFVGGSIAILVIGYMSANGNKLYFLFQKYGMIVALVSVTIAIITLFLSWFGVLDFPSIYNEVAGAGAYEAIAGIGPAPEFSFVETLNFMVWPAFAILFSVGMVSFSGEIKEVRRGPMKAIVGSMAIVAVFAILLGLGATNGLGTDFFYNAPSQATEMPFWPVISSFPALLGGNWVLTIVLFLWVIIIQLLAQGTNVIYGSRAMFAWGLDDMAPKRFASVSTKTHAPVFSIVILMVIAELVLALYSFTSLVTIISGLLMFSITFLVMSVTGIVFPYVKKDVYENSPATIKVLGLPLMSICGVIGAVFCSFMLYRCFMDKTAGGLGTSSMYIAAGIVVLSFIWYFAFKAYAKSKGEDVSQRYKEIPVE